MDVSAVLEQHKSQLKPVTVDRLIPVTLDVGNLTIFDSNPVDEIKKLDQKSIEEYLTSVSRDAAQLLYNALFSLPTTSNEDGVFVTLPEQITQLPREKPLPKERQPTRWEKFAKEKGIVNRKRSRMEYDEAKGEYRPRWGYGSAKNDSMNDWVVPVPQNGDAYEDVYAKQKNDKKERVAKNKKQQLQNQAVSQAIDRGEDPRVARKRELEQRMRASKKATASAGVFDQKIKGDIKIKGIKRQFESTVGDMTQEHKREADVAQKVIKNIANSKGDVNVKKAANLMQQLEERKNRLIKGDRKSGKVDNKKRVTKKRRTK